MVTLSVSTVSHILFNRYFPAVWFMPMASTAESVSSLTFCLSLPVLLMPEGQQVLCWTCLPLLPYKADLLKYFPHISSSSQKHLRFFFFPPYSICHCTSEGPLNLFITLQQENHWRISTQRGHRWTILKMIAMLAVRWIHCKVCSVETSWELLMDSRNEVMDVWTKVK